MKFWRSVTGLAALIFCGTSLVFTVGLWISIPGDLGGQVVAGLTATALELCKFSFAPFGLWLCAQRRPVGYALLALWPCLVVLSIAATVGFLESRTTVQREANARGSLEYRTLRQQLASVQQRIDTLNGVIATDAANGYRQRAIETAAQLENLEQQRSSLLAQVKTVRVAASDSAGATFASLAVLTHSDSAELQHKGFLALAIVADVVGLVALLAFSSVSTHAPAVKTQRPTVEHPAPAAERSAPTVTKEKTPAESVALNAEQWDLAERIRQGAFGNRPVLRRINREVRGGNQVVKPVFEYLQRSGVLVRDGRGFALADTQ